MQPPSRPTWDDTWLRVAEAMAARSSCVRGGVGAVVVSSSNRVLSTGYNGPPAGTTGECAFSCPRAIGAPKESCVAVHAEVNAVLYAGGERARGGTIYVTRLPCRDCTKVIAASGLIRVVCYVTEEDMQQARVPSIVQLLDEFKLQSSLYHRRPQYSRVY